MSIYVWRQQHLKNKYPKAFIIKKLKQNWTGFIPHTAKIMMGVYTDIGRTYSVLSQTNHTFICTTESALYYSATFPHFVYPVVMKK